MVGWLPLPNPTPPARVGPRRHQLLVRREDARRSRPVGVAGDPAVVELFGDLAGQGLVWDVVPITAEQVAAVTGSPARCRTCAWWSTTWPGRRWTPGGGSPGPTRSPSWPAARVALKVSVGVDALTAWPTWRPEVLRPYVAHVLEHFGPGRLMLASNWPVVLLRATYPQAWADLTAALVGAGAHAADLTQISGGTAERWYGLEGSR